MRRFISIIASAALFPVVVAAAAAGKGDALSLAEALYAPGVVVEEASRAVTREERAALKADGVRLPRQMPAWYRVSDAQGAVVGYVAGWTSRGTGRCEPTTR